MSRDGVRVMDGQLYRYIYICVRSAVDDAGHRLAGADEGELHHAHRHFATPDGDADVAMITDGKAREGDRLAQGGRETAGKDFTFAIGREHFLAVAEHALLVHDQADHHARYTLRLLLLERLAPDEVATFVQRDGPGERRLPGGDGLIHVLAVKIHAGFQAQRVARTES